MLIALIGPDRFLVGQSLKSYIAKYAPQDGGLGDLNMTRLDGARIGPDDLARSVQSIGFFGDTRLVIVEGLLARFGGSKAGDDEATDSKTDVAAPARGRGRPDPGLTEAF